MTHYPVPRAVSRFPDEQIEGTRDGPLSGVEVLLCLHTPPTLPHHPVMRVLNDASYYQ